MYKLGTESDVWTSSEAKKITTLHSCRKFCSVMKARLLGYVVMVFSTAETRMKNSILVAPCTWSTLQGGLRSVMVWSNISDRGSRLILRLQVQINSTKYIDMLSEQFLPFFDQIPSCMIISSSPQLAMARGSLKSMEFHVWLGLFNHQT